MKKIFFRVILLVTTLLMVSMNKFNRHSFCMTPKTKPQP